MHFYADHIYANMDPSTSDWNQLRDKCHVENKHGVQARKMFLELSHFSTSPDYNVAKTMNGYEFLTQRVNVCSTPPSILTVDHWNVGNVVEFVQRQNKGLV